ncbi:tachylectin-related carbohydrate-binding protein [Streptomyces fructofermentans]|uniref:tachylectin-related carbohydrate-binding protein n=1 Tax=Streptomyces fructofermentans TaxID=152141 RepID=UPI0037A96FCF
MPVNHATATRFAFYGIHPNGDLQWYRHDGWGQGTAHWTAGAGGNKVSGGWNVYDKVFSGGDGVIYGIYPNGDLQWYRHDGWKQGTAHWTAGAGGNKVSGGWNVYDKVFSGGDGVIYGIHPNGDLQWYRHDGWKQGTAHWTAGAGGNKVSGGWNVYGKVLSGGNGVIYGIYPNGDLQWYRHDGWKQGTAHWTAGAGGNKVSGGWNVYGRVLSGAVYMPTVRLHAKILTTPNVAVADAIARMQEVYATVGITVELASTETLNLPALNDLDTGECLLGTATAEQIQLFAHRNNAGPNDVVVYFVRSTVPPSNGCAAHPAGRPGAVVAQGATQWTLGHEVGHVLDLRHVNNNDRLMTGNGTSNITNPPPDLISDELTTMVASEFS